MWRILARHALVHHLRLAVLFVGIAHWSDVRGQLGCLTVTLLQLKLLLQSFDSRGVPHQTHLLHLGPVLVQ